MAFFKMTRRGNTTEEKHPKDVAAQRIRVDQPDQLREWANRLGVSAAELQRIISEVGNDPDKVRAYLNTRA
jgi:hypothetical protein